MKTTSSTAILILFFFVFSTKSCFLEVANAEPVLDIDGEKVQMGVEYYVVSAIRGGGGGGLELGSRSPVFGVCPKFVIQERPYINVGRPVTFWPVGTNTSVVQLSTDLNIVFVPGVDAYCRQSTMWKLDDYDPSIGNWWVTTGAIRGEPGPNTLTNWFKIEKSTDSSYKFRFCPSVCDSCITLCNDVGRNLNQDGQMRLALSLQGWPFKFIKASSVIKQLAN